MNLSLYRGRLVCLVLVALFLIGGCSENTSDSKQVFSGVRVENGILQSQTAINGKLEAVQNASVVSKVSGKVQAVNVDVGSVVKQGQVLMNLEADDLEANIQLAQAALDTAQIAYELATKNYERGKVLIASAALSQASFDDNYDGPYRKMEAALRSAQASLEKAHIAYHDTFIRAPFSGVITTKNINPGEIVLPQVPVITMVNIDQVLVKLGVGESQINQLKTGQTAEVMVAAAAKQTFTGTISAISPAADLQTKAYTVKIQVDNPRHVLKPGMFAEVKINTQPEPGLLLPKTALIDKAGDSCSVFAVENGKAKKRELVVGGSDQQNTLVLSGLKEGETVILAAPADLQDGQQVQIRVDNPAI
ncbi:MAG: efflux RND transporter periplasmic adaptor subunit [Syntrophomonadaceae bacterium]|nr:efflux RND transporter periplasmic adaptor subunit [Syntrophomonadaceae bacterium]